MELTIHYGASYPHKVFSVWLYQICRDIKNAALQYLNRVGGREYPGLWSANKRAIPCVV